MKKKVLSIFIILILLVSTNTVVFAETPTTSSQAKQQQKQTEAKQNETKQNLNNVTNQANSALQEVEDVKSSISKVEDEVDDLDEQSKKLDTSIKEKNGDLEEKQKLLEERLVNSYMNGEDTYLDALLSGGVVNFVTNYETIKQIANYDSNLITEVKNTKEELESEKIKVENVKVEKEAKSTELKALKKEKDAKYASLTDEQKKLQEQVDEYDDQMEVLKKKEKELVEKEKEEALKTQAIAKNNSNNNTVVKSTGQLGWPVPSSSTITSPYGYRYHPITGAYKFHAGIDIGASYGTDIVAADSGTVFLASDGYNGGYGNYVIINHGNGITTRYAHCSSLCVTEGQTVTKGQVIAKIGSTGASTGNHCHFEVRINGETQDPRNYV